MKTSIPSPMKNLLLLTIVMACSVVTAHGQGKTYKHSPSYQKSGEIKFGLKLGINNSWISYEDEVNSNSVNRLIFRQHAGAFGEYKFTDEVGLQLALLYSGQGVKKITMQASNSLIETKCKVKMPLDYIIVTTTLRLYPGAERQFCLFLGPYIGYLMSGVIYTYVDGKKASEVNLKSKMAYAYVDGKKNQEGQPVQVPELRNLDVGIVVGLDHEFPMGLILGLTCNVGLRNIFEEDKSKNLVMQYGLGYNFAKLMQ